MSDLDLIKELREKTGAGFLDCKNALIENNNSIDHSIDSLRKKAKVCSFRFFSTHTTLCCFPV
jgi:translation elongation factor EF-Ts